MKIALLWGGLDCTVSVLLTQIMHFNIIFVMNTWYKEMKRIVWVNPASFIKSLRDLMSGSFGRENVNAFSRLIKVNFYKNFLQPTSSVGCITFLLTSFFLKYRELRDK